MSKESFKKNLANYITLIRIAGTIVMVFMPALSVPFFIAYIVAGVTDAIDGFVARKLGTVSSFGSKLDSIADLLFYICMMIKILPRLIEVLPTLVFTFIVVIFVIRIAYYIIHGIKYKKFLSSHTILNKITGFLMFFVPFVLLTPFIGAYACLICGISISGVIMDVVESRKKAKE